MRGRGRGSGRLHRQLPRVATSEGTHGEPERETTVRGSVCIWRPALRQGASVPEDPRPEESAEQDAQATPGRQCPCRRLGGSRGSLC